MPTYEAGSWTAFRLRNFRRFEDTGTLPLPPITLLFGRNSSGKTSLLRALLLMKQFAESTATTDVPLVGPDVDFGSYVDLVHKGELRRDVRLSFDLDLTRQGRRYGGELADKFPGLLQRPTLDISLHWNMRNSRAQFDQIRIWSKVNDTQQICANRKGPGEFTLDLPSLSKQFRVPGSLNLNALRFLPIETRRTIENPLYQELDYLTFLVANQIQDAARSLVHVGPLRQMPDRAYRVDQAAQAGSVGSVVEILEKQRRAQRRVSQALSHMGMAKEVALKRLAPGYVGIVLTDPKTGRVENLADVGFGVSQVLPVLVTLATAAPGSTVLIEQPELHLHPDAQGQLADVLFEMSRERHISLLMETHSEHILLRLQRRIAEAESDLDPENVAAYFVDDGAVTRAGIDASGRLDNSAMPRGFFEEEWADAIALAQAAAQRSSK